MRNRNCSQETNAKRESIITRLGLHLGLYLGLYLGLCLDPCWAGRCFYRFCMGGAAFAANVFLICALSTGPANAANPASPASAPNKTPRIVVLGDSLSAEYGLAHGQGWVALLEQKLQAAHQTEEVVNASISGDTTSGGRSRLPAVLAQHPPTLLIIELGGNDALRGLPLKATEDNLRAMVKLGQEAGAQVLLIGMQVPPNYGRPYTEQFAKLFVQVAQSTHSGLVPFLLKGVADVPQATAHFQADGIHPKASEHPQMLANVWPEIQKLKGRKPL